MIYRRSQLNANILKKLKIKAELEIEGGIIMDKRNWLVNVI